MMLLLGAAGSEFRSPRSKFNVRSASLTPPLPGLVSGQYFAYAPGKCELTTSNVIENMFTTELGILLRTRPRLQQSKLLHYDLYTPFNPEERQFLRPGDVSMLKNSHFNPKWPVR